MTFVPIRQQRQAPLIFYLFRAPVPRLTIILQYYKNCSQIIEIIEKTKFYTFFLRQKVTDKNAGRLFCPA